MAFLVGIHHCTWQEESYILQHTIYTIIFVVRCQRILHISTLIPASKTKYPFIATNSVISSFKNGIFQEKLKIPHFHTLSIKSNIEAIISSLQKNLK